MQQSSSPTPYTRRSQQLRSTFRCGLASSEDSANDRYYRATSRVREHKMLWCRWYWVSSVRTNWLVAARNVSTFYHFAAEVLVMHLQCLTCHMANSCERKHKMLAKLLAQCKRLINWADVPLFMIWMNGAPNLVTACRHADTIIRYETRGWESANIWHRWASEFSLLQNIQSDAFPASNLMGSRALSQWVNRQVVNLSTHLHPVSRLRMSGTIHFFTPYAFLARAGKLNLLLVVWSQIKLRAYTNVKMSCRMVL